MKKHTKIYYAAFGYDESDWIKCEVIGCEAKADDIHHIDCRGMGGSKRKDYIENLQAICRHHHEKLGDRKGDINFLKLCHERAMKERGVKFIQELIRTDYK
jgi:hypothetical protein